MILIGTDPEVFLRSRRTKQFVSAAGNRFPGTKHAPYPLRDGAMQVDGHALEFNTNPAATEDDFVYNVHSVFQEVTDFVRDVDDDLEIVLEPIAEFDPIYFRHLPEHSKELGCTPDYDGRTGHVLPPPDIQNVPLRTASGHIHIGWTQDEDAFDPIMFKQRLEIAGKISPYLLETAAKWETKESSVRREFYGKNLSFRPKSYGVELRVLDSLWLASEERVRDVYRTTYDAFTKEFKELGGSVA